MRIGINCQNEGDDASVRFSGALIGTAMGPEADALAACIEDPQAHARKNRFVRQRPAPAHR